MMDSSDWDSLLQYVSEPLDLDFFPNERQFDSRAKSALGNYPSSSQFQVPTPPVGSYPVSSKMNISDVSFAVEDSSDVNTLVSVSTTFYPGANNDPHPPDTILVSSDSVFFYVHSHVLLGASQNGFKSMLPASPSKDKEQTKPPLHVRENSGVLNVILHTLYDMSCAHYSPPFDTLVSAVEALSTYGIHPRNCITPSTPLYTLLVSHAPLRPIDLYALAAHYDLNDLAVSTSSHLLSFPLNSLTDEMVFRIGPIYLKRLFFLHFGRADALKRILLPPPHPHAPTPWCDFTEQKKLTRAWALASAYLAWDARPDLSTSTMESALSPLKEHLSCELCRQSLQDRIKNLIVQWSVVKRTI